MPKEPQKNVEQVGHLRIHHDADDDVESSSSNGFKGLGYEQQSRMRSPLEGLSPEQRNLALNHERRREMQRHWKPSEKPVQNRRIEKEKQGEDVSSFTKLVGGLFKHVDKGEALKAAVAVHIPVFAGTLDIGLEAEAVRDGSISTSHSMSSSEDQGTVGLSGKLTIGATAGAKKRFGLSAAISGSIGVKAGNVKELIEALQYAVYRMVASAEGGTRNRLANFVAGVDCDEDGSRAKEGEKWARKQEEALFGEESSTEVEYGLGLEVGADFGDVAVKAEGAVMQSIDKDVVKAASGEERLSTFKKAELVAKNRHWFPPSIATDLISLSRNPDKTDALYHRLALAQAKSQTQKYAGKVEFEVAGMKIEVGVEWPADKWDERKLTGSIAVAAPTTDVGGVEVSVLTGPLTVALASQYKAGKASEKAANADGAGFAMTLFNAFMENFVAGEDVNKVTVEREYVKGEKPKDQVELAFVRSLAVNAGVIEVEGEKTKRVNSRAANKEKPKPPKPDSNVNAQPSRPRGRHIRFNSVS